MGQCEYVVGFHSSNYAPLDISKEEVTLIIAPMSYGKTTIPIKAANETINVETIITCFTDRVQLAHIKLNENKTHQVVFKHQEINYFILFFHNILYALSFHHGGVHGSEMTYFEPYNLAWSFKQQ